MEVSLNQDIKAIIPRPGVEPRFLAYWIRGMERPLLRAWRRVGATVEALESDLIKATPAPSPSFEVQQTIADFLDRETAYIDRLIEKKERLIELLEEKRSALITRAVTKGLDPDVPMKDSGVEWIGEIPEHWDVVRAVHVSQAVGGGTPPKDELSYWGGTIPWVSPKDMKKPIIDQTQDTITEQALRDTSLRVIQPPAVLLVVRGMILAHSLPVAVTAVPMALNQDMKALEVTSDVDPMFLRWSLEGLAKGILAHTTEEAAHGTQALRMDRWKVTRLPIPPMEEQRNLTNGLSERVTRIDRAVDAIRRSIALLRERRSALITAAVTGQIDVEEYAA